jgi:hypothetical protein
MVGSASGDGHAAVVLLVTLLTTTPVVSVCTVAALSALSVALAHLLSDGRRGPRRSHAASYSRDWWERAVPHMLPDDFARTFRVPRAVFDMLVNVALTSAYFAAPPHVAALPIALQVAMGLYK